MPKILVMSPPGPINFMRNGRCDFVSWSGCQWYPMILGYLAQYLKGKGHEVKFIDAQAEGRKKSDIIAHLRLTHYDYVVMMINSGNLHDDLFFAAGISLIHRVILVGPATTLHQGELRTGGYTFVTGEPEKGVEAIVKGLVDGEVRGVPLSSEELNAIPQVSQLFASLNSSLYVAPSEPHPFIDIMTARGCSYGKCSFCLWPKTYCYGYTPRDMRAVLDEIAWIEYLERYKGVMIQDDTLPEERAVELAQGLLSRGIKISWSCYVRAELKLQTLELMKRAGCRNLHVGYESGNDATLQRVCKGITTGQMRTFTKNAKRAGLHIHGDFMIGIDKTVAEIKKTVDFACLLRPHTAQFQVYLPFFGQKPAIGKEELEKWARKAYRRFYSNPGSWSAVAEQIGKPRVLKNAMEAVCKTS